MKFELTEPQKNIYALKKAYPESTISYISGQIILDNIDYDYEMINECVNNIIKTNDAYRIKIEEESLKPYQVIKDFEFEKLTEHDVSSFSDAEKKILFQNMAIEKMDSNSLIDFRIIKHADNAFGVYWKVDHLVADGFTAGIFSQQLLSNIKKYLEGNELEGDRASYTSLLDREKKYNSSDKKVKDIEYFSEKYAEEPTYSSLTVNPSNCIEASRYLEEIDVEDIRKFCTEHNITDAVFFETIIMMYLRMVSSSNLVTIGSPVLNRNSAVERKITGMFVSTNSFSVEINNKDTFLEVAEKIKKEKMELFRRQTLPFSEVQDTISKNTGYNGKLFDVVVSYQNAKLLGDDKEFNAKSEWYFNNAINNEIIFNIDDRDDDKFRLNVDYKNECFTPEQIREIVSRINILIKGVTTNPSLKLNEMKVFTSNDYNVYNSLNKNFVLNSDSKSFIEQFEQIAFDNPTNDALQYLSKTKTYQELNGLANSIAHNIDDLINHAEDIIPIIGPRNSEVISSLLALKKLNKGYFLLDETLYSKEMIDRFLERMNSSCFLASSETNYENEKVKKINVNDKINTNITENYRSKYTKNTNDIFCIIHTSGTTGEPKLVMVPEKGVASMAENSRQFTENSDSLLNLVNMSFDAFLLNCSASLVNGKKMILTSNEENNSFLKISEILENENKCSVIQTPTRMELMLNICSDESLSKINSVVLGAEIITDDLLDKIRSKTSNSKIYNSYGLTETTVYNVVNEINGYDSCIGTTIPNSRIVVVNDENIILPVSTIGEIAIVGDSVSLGYFGEEDKKSNFFIDSKSGQRGFKTGDFGYIRSDGNLVYAGRKDNQIKLNGLRIDIKQIESILNNMNGIKSSAVKVNSNGNNKFLVGFYELENGVDLEHQEIIDYLETKIPYYMIPQLYLKIDKIPLTPSGKIDYKNLPDFDIENYLSVSYVPPETDLEKQICRIWQEKFGIDKIGIETGFNVLGGTSRIFIDVLGQIENETSIYLNPVFFPKNPTIKDICEYIINPNKKELLPIENYNMNDIVVKQKNNNDGFLVTGANGFLGSHIVGDLLLNKKGNVYCLVRNIEKFKIAMKFYYGEDFNFDNPRLKIIQGDISKDDLGLKEDESSMISNNVGTIINCAADVSHFSTLEDAKKVNVDGVYNLCKIASEIGATFEHVSTLTVSGINVSSQKQENIKFSEQDLNIGQDYSHDAYLLTKYKSEELVRKFFDKGLNCSVYRTGYISARSYDDKFQINDDTSAFQMIVDTVKKIKIVPSSARNVKIQSAAVDKIAHAIVGLSSVDDRSCTYHIFDPNVSNMIDYLEASNIPFEIVSDEEFNVIADKILLGSENNNDTLVYKYLKNFLTNETSNEIVNDETMKKLNSLDFRYR